MHLLLSRWMKALNTRYLFPYRLETQKVVVSDAATRAGDPGCGYLTSLFHRPEAQKRNLSVSLTFTVQRLRTLNASVSVSLLSVLGHRLRTCICFCLSPYRLTETQYKECLLEGNLYPFLTRRGLQFGTFPFPCCDCLFPSEWGKVVWSTLRYSCGTSLHSQTHIQKSVT